MTEYFNKQFPQVELLTTRSAVQIATELAEEANKGKREEASRVVEIMQKALPHLSIDYKVNGTNRIEISVKRR